MKDNVSIVFTGDIAFTKYFASCDDVNNYIDDSIIDFMRSSDYCIGNIEGPILQPFDSENKPEFQHCSLTNCLESLQKLKVNVWSLANNHMFDFGENGIKQTLECAKQSNCDCIGIISNDNLSETLIVNECGGIGVFAVTYDNRNTETYKNFYWKDFDRISNAIKRIKETCRRCIVIAHAGEEFSPMPLPETRRVFKRYLDMGADVVIGHHPHVVENYETCENGLIFYSLGNFIFDTDYQRAQSRTDVGVVVKLTISADDLKWQAIGIKINRDTQSISKCEPPTIFVDVQEKQYRRLWKYSARSLSIANRRIDLYFRSKRPSRFKVLKSFMAEIKRCMKDYSKFKLYCAKILSYIPNYIRIEDRKLKAYIVNNVVKTRKAEHD